MRRGQQTAFGELYRVFAPKLYREVLMPKLGHAQLAQDALSDTFASFLEHHAELDAREQSLMSWLARVASNKATDMHRKRARLLRSLASFESLLAPLSASPTTDGTFEDRELRELSALQVTRTLHVLNPRYRRALELRFFEEQPRERCAELLEVKLGTFDVLLLRALRAFRREWEQLAQAQEGGEP
jgi:RNA polymerase sigma-70 factor (ECF subfamily)